MAQIIYINDKEGNRIKYKVRVCIGRDENYNQIIKSKTFPWPKEYTPAAAEKEVANRAYMYEQKLKADYKNGVTAPDKITLSDFVRNRWWQDYINNGKRSPNSIAFYDQMSTDIVEYFGEKKLLSEIKSETILKYIKYLNTEARLKVYDYKEIPFSVSLDDDGHTILSWQPVKKALSYQISRKGKRSKSFSRVGSTTENTYVDNMQNFDSSYQFTVKARTLVPGDQPYSETTRVRHYQTLCNILRYAVRHGYLEKYPVETLDKSEKPQLEKKKIDFLTQEQAQQFVAALEAKPLFWRTYYNILLTCGLRRGEAVGLQWGDIDSKKLEITIARSITVDKKRKEKYSVKKPKNGEERTVPITSRIYNMLTALKKEAEDKYGEKMIKPTSYIFCRIDDPQQPIYPTEPTRWLRKFEEENNLPLMSPHDLRHTAATLALESGKDIKHVQDLLGHHDPATTMAFYAGVTEEGAHSTVEGIESLLIGKKTENQETP